MPKRPRLVAVFFIAGTSFIAGAIVALTTVGLTTTSVWALTQQNLLPNGNYDFNYGPSDDKNKSDKSTNKSDPNSPGFHFSIERGQTGPFGFRSFGGDRNASPPDYSRPLGNGD